MNDKKVSDIGAHVRELRVRDHQHDTPCIDEWEYFHVDDPLRLIRKITQSIIDLLVFFTPNLISYVVIVRSFVRAEEISTSMHNTLLALIATFIAVITVAYLYQLFAYSKYGTHKRAPVIKE